MAEPLARRYLELDGSTSDWLVIVPHEFGRAVCSPWQPCQNHQGDVTSYQTRSPVCVRYQDTETFFFFFLSSLQLQGRSFVRFVLMDYSTLCHKSSVFSFLVPGVLDGTSKSSGLLVLHFKFEIV